MPSDEQPDATLLLQRAAGGDLQARDDLLAVLYEELRRLARRQMSDQRAGHTLQATALVNEAYMRLIRSGLPREGGRGQFLALAATAMRSILVDHARAKSAAKRGGGRRAAVELDEIVAQYEERAIDLLAVDEALGRLAAFDAGLARIVELRFFGGLASEDIGEALGVSKRTVERGWRTAQAWLARELSPHADA